MKHRITLLARQDIDEYSFKISLDDAKAAIDWVDQIIDRVHRIAKWPGSGGEVPELENEKIREVIVYSHRVIYRINEDGIEILRVFHGARNLTLEDIKGEQDE